MRHNDQWHSATVRERRDLSAQVREFEIRPEGGLQPWSVGAHLDLRVQVGGREEQRSYSLVGLPEQAEAGGAYRIAVRRADPSRGGSRYLWRLETGDELLIGEPNQHFELGLKAIETLLMAGGIGITPMLGMAQLLARQGAKLRMCYAARSPADLVYADTLREALGSALRTFCSEAGERIDLDAEIAALAPGAQLALCGPLRMMDAAREAWARAGRPQADLRFETFGNSGRHAAEPFWVELPRHQPAPAGAGRAQPAAGAGGSRHRHAVRLQARRMRAVRDGHRLGAGRGGPPRRVLQRRTETLRRAAVRLRVACVRRRRGARFGLPARLHP